MSHAIDFEGLTQKLFVLQHMSLGARDYCIRHELDASYDAGYEVFDSYWGYLKVLVSNYLIECSIKARMIQEFCENNDEEGELAKFESEAMDSISLGIVHAGSFKLSLREACNKIVHAKRVILPLKREKIGEKEYQYWDGRYHLYGNKGKDQWHLEIDVEAWSRAMSHYLHLLEEKSMYMGQDW